MVHLITLYGKDDSHKHLFTLLTFLNNANIAYIAVDSDSHVYRNFEHELSVIITETDNEASLSHKGDILIIKKEINDKKFSLMEKDFCITIISDNITPQICDADKEQRIITCGTHQKSSVTVSSNNDENLCVFIQRKLHTLSGRTIDPQELVLPIRENSDAYDIMSSSISLLLLS